eukprot:Pgem_evm1s17954
MGINKKSRGKGKVSSNSSPKQHSKTTRDKNSQQSPNFNKEKVKRKNETSSSFDT